MAKKRAKINVDELNSADLFAQTDKPQHPRSPSKQRLKAMATYDVGPEIKESIKSIATSHGIPASQLAKYLLTFALDMWYLGEIEPPPLEKSNSPKFRNTIDFGDVEKRRTTWISNVEQR